MSLNLKDDILNAVMQSQFIKNKCKTPKFRKPTVPQQYDSPPMPPVKPPKREPMKEFDEMYDSIVGKYYTIQVTACSNVCGDMMSPHFLKRGLYKTYKNVKLVNINGMGIGQVHFVTDDGHYLLLPWCYIIAMFPEKENEKC